MIHLGKRVADLALDALGQAGLLSLYGQRS